MAVLRTGAAGSSFKNKSSIITKINPEKCFLDQNGPPRGASGIRFVVRDNTELRAPDRDAKKTQKSRGPKQGRFWVTLEGRECEPFIIYNIPLFEKRFDLPSSVLRSIPSYAHKIGGAESNRDSTHLKASANHVPERIEVPSPVHAEERLISWWPLHLSPSSALYKSFFQHALTWKTDKI